MTILKIAFVSNSEVETKIQRGKKKRFEIEINTYLTIISLNVNGLNTPIKRHTVAG